jgi:NAD-dependent dihydropyrimidine dehydrogenase PreA subunit
MARAKKTRPTMTTWRQRELPQLDERRCSTSRRCVEVCPTNCLAMEGRNPVLARPADCISCGVCVLVCPTEALTLAPRPDDGTVT